LPAAGKNVLLIESRDRLGGPASSEQIGGFTVNLGAISLSRGGALEETFTLLGVTLGISEPSTGVCSESMAN
jgi:phytoene dehydrogenase-like protein